MLVGCVLGEVVVVVVVGDWPPGFGLLPFIVFYFLCVRWVVRGSFVFCGSLLLFAVITMIVVIVILSVG